MSSLLARVGVKVVAGQKSQVEMSRIGGDVRLPDSFTVGRGVRVDKAARGKQGGREASQRERAKTELNRLSDWST
jgi:hypothetical protein